MPTREVVIYTCEACGIEKEVPVTREISDPGVPEGWCDVRISPLERNTDSVTWLVCGACADRVSKNVSVRERPMDYPEPTLIDNPARGWKS